MLYIDPDQSAFENVQKTLNVVKQIINVLTHVPMDNSVMHQKCIEKFSSHTPCDPPPPKKKKYASDPVIMLEIFCRVFGKYYYVQIKYLRIQKNAFQKESLPLETLRSLLLFVCIIKLTISFS